MDEFIDINESTALKLTSLMGFQIPLKTRVNKSKYEYLINKLDDMSTKINSLKQELTSLKK